MPACRTMFETDSLDPEWVRRCNLLHEIWVPTAFHQVPAPPPPPRRLWGLCVWREHVPGEPRPAACYVRA